MKLKNLNLGIVSCIIAILSCIIDLSYGFIFNNTGLPIVTLNYFLLALILLAINLFSILLGCIGLFKNKYNNKKRTYSITGIVLNLLVILYIFFLRSAFAFFITKYFLIQ